MGERPLIKRSIDAASRIPAAVLARVYFDISVEGLHHIPSEGPFVMAANHFSHLDPPFIGFSTPRTVRFLAVDELFGRSRIFDLTMQYYDAIPLDRDGYPIAAMRTAIDHLESGHPIGLFPEGRRVEQWGGNDAKRGAAWLAWMTGSPLIPVSIWGTQHTMSPTQRGFNRTAVRLWYDEPLWWYDYADRIDPVGSMTTDWFTVVDGRLSDWMEL
ncbi:MAG: lysophospholipid acyltransferase family protein [Acidimicrobiia bacterium]